MKKRNALLGLVASLGVVATLVAGPAAAEDRPIKIVMSSTPSFTWLPFLVSQKVSIPELERTTGRKVEVTYSPTTTPAVLGLISGDYDFGIAYVQHAIKAQAEGRDLVVLTALMDNPTVAVVVRSDLDQIKTIADLKGTSMGVVSIGSGHHMMGVAVAKAAGLQPDDVTYRAVGGLAGLTPALRSKRVDEVIVSEPTLSAILKEGLGRILIDLHSKDATRQIFHGPHPTVALLARKEFVDAHPDLARAMVKSQVDALKWIQSHSHEEIAATLPDELKKRPDVGPILDRVLPAVSATGKTAPEAINVAVDLMKQMGELKSDAAIDPKKVVDDQFIDAGN